MLKWISDYGRFMWEGFGFKGAVDFIDSTFHTKSIATTLAMSGIAGVVASYIEKILGLDPIAYLLFVILVIVEFVSGIRAAIKEKQKIESRKFGRMILKILVYTLLIALVNGFKVRLEVPLIFGEEINIYSWVYYAVVNMILIQLLISVLENLGRLGFAETNKVTQFLYFKLSQWFEIPSGKPEVVQEQPIKPMDEAEVPQDQHVNPPTKDMIDDIQPPPGADSL